MKTLTLISEFSEEFSAGSTPTIANHIFDNEIDKKAFIDKWDKDNSGLEKSSEKETTYYTGGYSYWLKIETLELNK